MSGHTSDLYLSISVEDWLSKLPKLPNEPQAEVQATPTTRGTRFLDFLAKLPNEPQAEVQATPTTRGTRFLDFLGRRRQVWNIELHITLSEFK